MNHLSGQTCFDVLRMDSFKVVLVNMKIGALYLLVAKKRRAGGVLAFAVVPHALIIFCPGSCVIWLTARRLGRLCCAAIIALLMLKIVKIPT